MKRAAISLGAGLLIAGSVPLAAHSAWFEHQNEAWRWLYKVDPSHDSRQSDSERPWVSAVVRGVNLTTGELRIHHNPIPRVGMPAMIMTFPVRDLRQLQKLRIGDIIQVQVAAEGGTVKVVNLKLRK